ncbi:MAG: NAD(+)/NADH kinase [Candidatus Heimdallarchaeota archaeon]|nr:NAD(+)/NADH kinase [Candidatus Heimdallarchaeota archaeon]
MKIGLLVNPIAGVGAKLAWKGTDNIQAAWNEIQSIENAPIWQIINRAIVDIEMNSIEWILGGELTRYLSFQGKFKIVGSLKNNSTAQDTKILVEEIVNQNVDLVIFAGGDGTAIDISDKVGDIPIIGIPAGVKIFSPCFLHRPEDLRGFLSTWNGNSKEVDLFDIDEEAYKKGLARPILKGKVRIPFSPSIQVGKSSFANEEDDDILESIAQRIIDDQLLHNKSILAGSGSTIQKIFKYLGIEKSLLGLSIINDGKLIADDVTHQEILDYLKIHEIHELWLSPIGQQGHILGRGNRQIPQELFNMITNKAIRVFSTPEKIHNTPYLYSDAGNIAIDRKLQGIYKVIVSYHETVLRKLLI